MTTNSNTGKFFLASLFIIALAGTLLAAAAGEDWTIEAGAGFGKRMDSWMPLAIAAILICVFANALAYMAGTILQSESVKRYAKSEFIEVSASALMIFFAVSLVYTLVDGTSGPISGLDFVKDLLGEGSTISCTAATGGVYHFFTDADFGGGPLGAYKCKLQEKITALDVAYNNVVEANMGVERTTSFSYSAFGVPIYVGDWNMRLHKQVEENHLVATKIVSLLVPLHAQFALAQYLQNNMLSVFLPMGLLLRIFPFTRGIGGLFIAIAIGFFFVWPTFFILTDPTYVKADKVESEMLKGMCFTGFTGAATVLPNALLSASQGGQSSLALASGTRLVYEITVATLFYPFVALVITLIFIRAVTPLLGGDTGEIMRMVSRLG